MDGVWQAQGCPESATGWGQVEPPEGLQLREHSRGDSNTRAYVNSLGLMSTLSQPVLAGPALSPSSQAASITDEFSRFMVNQMENEGRGFELLLDYYAGKNASSILNSAVQQACRKMTT